MHSRSGKKLLLFLIVCILTPGLAGCWDRIEVNDLALSMAASIDKVPHNQIRYSKQIAVPGQMGGSGGGGMTSSQGKTFMVVSAVGSDMKDAMENIQLKMSRKLFLAHRRLFLIGEGLARKGIRGQMDEMSRNPQTRLRTNVAVTHGDAEKYLNIQYPFERAPSEALRQILYGEQADFKMDIKELMIMLSTPGADVMVPMIKLASLAPGNKKGFEADGLAVFKDDRMVGTLTNKDARGVLWLRDQVKSATITLNIPGQKGKISLNLLRVKTNFQTQLLHNHPAIQIEFLPEVDIIENETNLDLTSARNVGLIEKEFAKTIKQMSQHTLYLLQHKYHSDIVKFGDRVHHAYPHQWKSIVANWHQEFSQMPVKINVNVKVRRVGMTGPPLDRYRNGVKE